MAEKIIVDDDTSEVISATSKAELASKKTNTSEYADTTGAYPRRAYSGVSGINKAATGNETNHVYTGGGDALVNLREAIPESRYNSSVYPKNQVRESPSGHVTEIDDTPGSERVLHKHRSGSGVEMLADGTVIYSSTGNCVKVTLQDEKVIVEGDAQLSYNGNLTLDVSGDFDVKVGGNYNIEVAGNKIEKINGSQSTKISKQFQTEIGTNKLETIVGTETKQVFANQFNIVKGNMHHIVEGTIKLNSKGILSTTSEEEIQMSSDNINIAANDMSVFGATGTFGGDGVLFSGQGATFEKGVTASKFTGDLDGTAASAVVGGTDTDPGSSHSFTVSGDGTPAITKPNASIMLDYLTNSDRAIGKVSVDTGDHMKNNLPGNRSTFYGNVTSDDPTSAETRALLKDPDNMANTEFLGAVVASGKLSDKYNNPAPPAIGRIVNPDNAKFRGDIPIGQSGKRAAKRFML